MSKLDPMLSTEHLSKPETAILQVGARHASQRMFYTIWDMEDSQVVVERWNHHIPEPMGISQAEYYALFRGLRTVLEAEYSQVRMLISAAPILLHLGWDNSPSSELEPYYRVVENKLEMFEYVEHRPYSF